MGDMADHVNDDTPWDGCQIQRECPYCLQPLREITPRRLAGMRVRGPYMLVTYTHKCDKCHLLFE